MKSVLISGVLLMVMAAYLVIPALPVFDYLINRDYIARNLCVNKDKPKSCCKGKCHMVKQLQKTNQGTEDNPKNTNVRIQLKDMNDFLICSYSSFVPAINSNKYFICNIFTFDQMARAAIFIPPKLSSTGI